MGSFCRRLIGGISVKATYEIERVILRDVVVENDAPKHERYQGEKNLETGLSTLDMVIRQQTTANNLFILQQRLFYRAVGSILVPPAFLA